MASIGYFTARVYTSSAQLPIRDATVALTQATSSGTRQIATRLTDESGRIPPIPIAAPERSESQQPGTTSPYTDLSVTVEYPGYERVLIEGLQIFSDTVTEQDVELLPLEELPQVYNMTELIEIPSQEL